MDVVGAPTPLKISGKNYTAYPLREIDHDTFSKWCRREYLDRVRESTDDEDIIRVAIHEIQDMQWFREPGRIVAYTVAGMHKLACIMCRTEIPYSLIKSTPGAIGEITSVFMSLHQSSSPEKPGGQSGN